MAEEHVDAGRLGAFRGRGLRLIVWVREGADAGFGAGRDDAGGAGAEGPYSGGAVGLIHGV